jgi:hypothetical protein
MYPLTQLKKATLLILISFALGCFVLSPTALAQLSPAPDGGYPNANTAEGDAALFSLTTGSFNTAVGNSALASLTDNIGNTALGAFALTANTGGANTATGVGALLSNDTGNGNTADGIGALLSTQRAAATSH